MKLGFHHSTLCFNAWQNYREAEREREKDVKVGGRRGAM
jgi:hypothetical protein